MKQAKKKVSATVSKLTDEKALGPEPFFDYAMSQVDVIKTLNWYNYMYDQDCDKARDFILDFLKSRNVGSFTQNKVRKYPAIRIPLYVGWICRQMTINSQIPDQYKLKALNAIKNIAETEIEESSEETNVVAFTPSVQDRIRAKTSAIIAEFEALQDAFFETFEAIEVPYDLMIKLSVTSQIAKSISEYYAPKLDEMNLVLKGKDEQLKEGYSCYTKAQIKKVIAFYQSIIDDCDRIINNTKAVRKPRKKKVKTAEVQIAKIKYQKENFEYKIKSIDPTHIIGSNQLWLFNTKTRTLTMLNSERGLAMKGTTILNFDENTSVSKRIRKPEEVLKEVLSGGKVALRKLMQNIKTKEIVANGRVNSDTIILRSIR